MERLRWGIMGTGQIASAFARDLRSSESGTLAAVGSRHEDTARKFAQEFGAERAHGSYRELLDDENIDALYVATPHTMHRDAALGAIQRGLPVLVEKSFTATIDGTCAVVVAAREAGVFCMEAMWTRFLPTHQAVRDVVDSGEIGEVMNLNGTLCSYRDYDPQHRLFAQELGGGTLLDLGVYPVSYAQWFLGPAAEVHAVARPAANGVDYAASLAIAYEGGGLASFTCGFDAKGGTGRMEIVGSKGRIEIDPMFHHADGFTVFREGAEPRRVEARAEAGYHYEADHVAQCLAEGLTESPVINLDDTADVMRVLDDAAHQANVDYQEIDQPELLKN